MDYENSKKKPPFDFPFITKELENRFSLVFYLIKILFLLLIDIVDLILSLIFTADLYC